MLYEYAVEPAAVAASVRDFHQLLDLSGFHRGRAIATCPRNWADEVARMINRSEHIGDAGKRALLTKLERIRKFLFFPGQRPWPPRGEWPDLAY
jgi:hypothetical protein